MLHTVSTVIVMKTREKVAPREGLSKFLVEFHSHRTAETRIMLLISFVVFIRLMFFNESEETRVTYSSLIFAALCVLVIVFNAWLDYFPSRLSGVKLRAASGQGLPLACLLLPTLATACLHHTLLHQFTLSDLLFLYMNLVIQMSLATILSTLLHIVPYPNSVVFYLFACGSISYLFQWWIGTPMLLSLPTLLLFSALVSMALIVFPKSFTLAEVIILSQGLTLCLIDTLLLVSRLHSVLVLPLSYERSVSLLYVELLVSGVALCCVLFCPLLSLIAGAQTARSHRFWSATFFLLSMAVGVLFFLRWLGALVGRHPIALVFSYITSSRIRLILMSYWLLVSMATGMFLWAQSREGHWLKSSKPAGLWSRKFFHISALAVYVPGLILDVDFLSFAASMTTFLFIVAELVRVVDVWPVGTPINSLLNPLCDQREQGPLILSHIYLLLGFSVPLWLSPRSGATKLGLYSGVLSLGVGDSMAALAGTLFGKLQWPGTTKTVEGTLMSVLSQLSALCLIIALDIELPSISLYQWTSLSAGIVVTALLEALPTDGPGQNIH